MKLPKQFIINTLYTVVGEPFGEWVKERVIARNAKIIDEQQLAIDLDPEIAAAFN